MPPFDAGYIKLYFLIQLCVRTAARFAILSNTTIVEYILDNGEETRKLSCGSTRKRKRTRQENIVERIVFFFCTDSQYEFNIYFAYRYGLY